MSVRPHPKKPGTWIIDYYPQGRKGPRERIPIEGTRAEAVKIEQGMRLEAKGSKPTVLFPHISEVIPEFMQWYSMDHQPKGVQRTQYSLDALLQLFGPYQFTGLTSDLVELFKRRRLAAGIKPTTINKELSALSKLCKWAKKKGYCQKVPDIERFPEKLTKAPLPNVPDQDDIERMIAAVPWPKQGLFYCLYYGGLRAQEAAPLRVENINLKGRVMTVLGKGNKERVVPILRYLMPILERRLQEVDSGYLWPTVNGVPLLDMRETIKWASKRAGVKAHITPHSLRHAFAIRAVQSGIHLRVLQLVLGHSSVKVTEIYTNMAASQIASEMEKW